MHLISYKNVSHLEFSISVCSTFGISHSLLIMCLFNVFDKVTSTIQIFGFTFDVLERLFCYFAMLFTTDHLKKIFISLRGNYKVYTTPIQGDIRWLKTHFYITEGCYKHVLYFMLNAIFLSNKEILFGEILYLRSSWV